MAKNLLVQHNFQQKTKKHGLRFYITMASACEEIHFLGFGPSAEKVLAMGMTPASPRRPETSPLVLAAWPRRGGPEPVDLARSAACQRGGAETRQQVEGSTTATIAEN